MNTRIFLVLALVAGHAHAWDCKFERDISKSLDVANTTELDIEVVAGDLQVKGRKGLKEVTVSGKVCASKQEWADASDIVLNEGDRASIAVVMPEHDSNWSWTGSQYIYIDIVIEVPDNLPLSITDSSGDIEVENTASVSIRDSSGGIEVTDVVGDVVLEDSSGDIELRDIEGDVTVRHDSSGEIAGRDIGGSVLVAKDSSGDIRFRDVRGNFTVERDSSGDIVANGVGGDFRVDRDGSGNIRADNVSGEIIIPDKG